LNPHVPEEVEKAILKALSKLPDDRYANPCAMIAGLQNCMLSLSAKPKAQKRTREEKEYLRLFVNLGNRLNYKYSDIIAKENSSFASLAPIEEDKRIVSSLNEEDSEFEAMLSDEDGQHLSLFAYLGYRLGYDNTAISAYEKLLNEIDKGTVTQLELREVLCRLDDLYARRRKLPK